MNVDEDEGNEVFIEKTISPSELTLELVDREERRMGAENCYKLMYSTDEFEIERLVYEYPEYILSHIDNWGVNYGEVEIVEDNIDYSDLFQPCD